MICDTSVLVHLDPQLSNFILPKIQPVLRPFFRLRKRLCESKNSFAFCLPPPIPLPTDQSLQLFSRDPNFRFRLLVANAFALLQRKQRKQFIPPVDPPLHLKLTLIKSANSKVLTSSQTKHVRAKCRTNTPATSSRTVITTANMNSSRPAPKTNRASPHTQTPLHTNEHMPNPSAENPPKTRQQAPAAHTLPSILNRQLSVNSHQTNSTSIVPP